MIYSKEPLKELEVIISLTSLNADNQLDDQIEELGLTDIGLQ